MKFPLPLISALVFVSACTPTQVTRHTAPMPGVRAPSATRPHEQASFPNLQKTAETGDAIAEYRLGRYYQEKEHNNSEGMNWYLKSADQGDADAEYALGIMYFLGEGIKQDDRQAVTWWKMAADRGHFVAQWNLGGMYEVGKGVKEDNVEAYRWYMLALNNRRGTAGGDPKTGRLGLRRQINSLAKRMTSEEIAQAKRLADNWKPILAPRPACGVNGVSPKSVSVWCDASTLLFVRPPPGH